MKTIAAILALLLLTSLPAQAEEKSLPPETPQQADRTSEMQEKLRRVEEYNEPIASLYVASMKIGGATFWLHYTGASEAILKEARAIVLSPPAGYPSPGGEISCAQAWLDRMKIKSAKPMRLGQLELTVEGNARAGAKKIIEYAEAGSGDHVYMLAHLHFHGVGVEKNHKTAYDLLRSVGPGGGAIGPPDCTPGAQHNPANPAEAVAGALTFDADGKRRKVDFKMPGEPGAPVTYGYAPFAAKEPEPPNEDTPFAMPAFEEGLTLYPPPYPEAPLE
jgi:hypothetical protein